MKIEQHPKLTYDCSVVTSSFRGLSLKNLQK